MNNILILQDKLLKTGINTKIILTVFILSSLLLVITPLNFLITITILAVLSFFLIKPDICYYLVILTVPFTERMRFLPISFSVNDVLILICSLSVLINMIIRDERIELRTKIDKWIVVLLLLYFAAGIHSLDDRGILTSFKFLEAILTYYMTVYFIRSKEIKLTDIIKIITFTAVFQALFGIFQSVTGSCGVMLRTDRGYLGYLGIGPKTVWHGLGTLSHSATLADFLIISLILIFPIYKFDNNNKNILKTVIYIILAGIYFTYSRMGLIALILTYVLYKVFTGPDKTKTLLQLSTITALIAPFILYFMSFSTFNSTDRNTVWVYPITALAEKPIVWLTGNGLNSYLDFVKPYFPIKISTVFLGNFFAHNYYLLTVVEMGIISLTVQILFLINIFFLNLNKFNSINNLNKSINLSLIVLVPIVLVISLTDHFLALTFTQVLLFIIYGCAFADNIRKTDFSTKQTR